MTGQNPNAGALAARVSHGVAYAMLTGVMLLWAGGVVVARSVHELTPPIGFSFWRWCTAVALLSPFALPRLRPHLPYIRARLPQFALLGLFMAGGSTLLVWSVQYTSATNAALVSATQPIVTAVVAWWVLRERLAGVQLAGVAAATLGVLVMVVRMNATVLRTLDLNPGDVLVLLAVGFYALYSVNLHRWVAALPPLLTMYMTCLGGLFVILPFYLVETALVTPHTVDVRVIAAIVFMATVPTLIATTMWNIGVGVVGVNRASTFINLLPIFGTLLAVALLGEALRRYHVVGGLLVCAGITLVIRHGRAGTAPQPSSGTQ